MSKNASSKKPAIVDAAAEGAAIESSGLLSPRAERQRAWTKRADEAAAAIQQVQQLVQQHNADVDSAKHSLEQLALTAKPLWAFTIEDLAPQYRDKSRPSSQRVGSAASARGGSGAEQRSSSKQGQRAGSATATPAEGTAASAGTTGSEASPAPETVESAIRQLAPAQRSKVSAALQTLFYAPAAVSPTMSSVAPPTAVPKLGDGGKVPYPAVTGTPSSPQRAGSGNGSAEGDSALLSETARKGNTIPPLLLNAVRELQGVRIQLEAQLAVASSAAAQQLQRLQFLQEEAMVAQYALEALRGDAAHPSTT